jgi:hypothetical protein
VLQRMGMKVRERGGSEGGSRGKWMCKKGGK